MGELVVVVCAAGKSRCDTFGSALPERDAAVRQRFHEARALLEPAGLWVDWPVVVLDARLSGALATTFRDAAREGFPEYPARPVVSFDTRAGAVPDLDVVLHELTHVWLRAAGAGDARWRLEVVADRKYLRANHQSALVHEGVADFVAGALTGDPVLGEGHMASSSLRVEVTCPDGLTGSPHADAALVSGALWELGGAGRDAAAMSDVLAAVRGAAVDGSRDVASFVDALTAVLSGRDEHLWARWGELVHRRGLTRCAEPIALGKERFAARTGELVAAGRGRFVGTRVGQTGDPPGEAIGGPLGFSARVREPAEGLSVAKVMARSSETDTLVLDWRALGHGGAVLDTGRAPLVGWPSQWATVVLPSSSQTLDFVFTTNTSNDIAYNDVRIAWEFASAPAHVSSPVPHSGCDLAPGLELGGVWVAAWTVWRSRAQRFRRVRTSVSGTSQSDSQGRANNERDDKPRR